MTVLAFDTLQFANRLKAAGVPAAHAEAEACALAEVFVDHQTNMATKQDLDRLEREMATKQDLERLEREMEREIGQIRQDVARLEISTQDKMDRLEERLKAKIEKSELRLHGEMLALNRQMSLLRGMMGVMVVGLASLIFKAFALQTII